MLYFHRVTKTNLNLFPLYVVGGNLIDKGTRSFRLNVDIETEKK